MDHAISGSIFTVVVFVSFIAIVLWAYNRKSKKGFDEAANLIFDDEDKHQATQQKRESSTNE